MAIYHLRVSIVSRGKGQSAVAASAYQNAERMLNQYDGKIKNYTKKENVIEKGILLPENAPDKCNNKEILWNEVEKLEKTSKAQLARRFEISLPKELKLEQQKALTLDFANQLRDQGMCVDYAIHNSEGNPHAHLLCTTRPLDPNGQFAPKQRKVYDLDLNGNKIYDKQKKTYKCHTQKLTDWDDKGSLVKWRQNWAEITNKHLEKAGLVERIDHRSYEKQGIDQIPLKNIGHGQKNLNIERNEEIRKLNLTLEKNNSKITELKHERWKIKYEENKKSTIKKRAIAKQQRVTKGIQQDKQQIQRLQTIGMDSKSTLSNESRRQSNGRLFSPKNTLRGARKPNLITDIGRRQEINQRIEKPANKNVTGKISESKFQKRLKQANNGLSQKNTTGSGFQVHLDIKDNLASEYLKVLIEKYQGDIEAAMRELEQLEEFKLKPSLPTTEKIVTPKKKKKQKGFSIWETK